MSNDYDSDFYGWTQRQAALLKKRAHNDEIDWDNVAEEIETLGRSDRREIRSRLDTILLHSIKLASQPNHRSARKWGDTVFEQRRKLKGVLEESPSLGDEPAEKLKESYAAMRKRALRLRFADIPESCPWTIDNVLADDWLP